MEVRIGKAASGNTAILQLHGPLTLATLHLLEDALKAAAGWDLVIDVAGAPYVDSAGLGTILRQWSDSSKSGKLFAVVGVTPRIAMLLEITKVNTILPAFATAEEADRNFSAARSAAARA